VYSMFLTWEVYVHIINKIYCFLLIQLIFLPNNNFF
jgi:hypothetical protein